MFKNINLQFIISYFGLLPYLALVIDKYFIYQFEEEFIFSFIIYYTIIILVFIGSTNWNLNLKIKNIYVIYGFMPSFLTTIIVVLNLFGYSKFILIFFLAVTLLLQLIFDYILIYNNKNNVLIFYLLRLPLTVVILLSLVILTQF